MDAYFASVEQADNPNLIGKPVIVCGNPKSRSVVSACSYEARKYGINSGMSVIEALSLCPSLISIPTNHSRYIEVSKKIFNCIRSFTEEMEIYSIDEVFIDVTDIINLYRGVKNLCVEIKKKIQRDTALPSSCGAVPNKLISKIASSYAKPDGIKIVEPSEIDNFMRTLPKE